MNLLVLFALLFGLQAPDTFTAQNPAQTPTQTRDQVLAQWEESIDLDLHGEVVRDARERMSQDGSWAKDGRVLALYSRALTATVGVEQAREFLIAAKPPETGQPVVDLALARLQLLSDELEELIDGLTTDDRESPVRYPDHADSWWLIGKAYARLGKAERAAPYLQQFVQRWRMHPEAPAAWHQLSQLALAKRDMAAAKKYREQGQNLSTWHGYYKARRLQARRNPQDALPRFGLAQLWSSVQEYVRASQEIERCLALDPKFARAWALKGEIARKENRMSAAFDAYSRALELDGTLGDARYNRAVLALQAGENEIAEQDLSAIVDGPESTADRYLVAHLSLARLLKELGRMDDAESRFARYKQLGGKESL